MKIKRLELLNILTDLRPGLASKEIIEQSTSFIFSDGQVVTYNDEVAIQHPVDLDIAGAVQGKELFALLNKLKEDEIDIESTESELIIHGKKSKAGIKLEVKTTFDETIKTIGTPDKWSKLPKGLLGAISFCLFSVGRDMTKPLLTCVYVEKDEVMSSDGTRITLYQIPETLKTPFCIPGTPARQLKNYELVEYSTTDGWIHFRTEQNVIFSCRTFVGEYPAEKLRNFIQTTKGGSFSLPSDLSDTLERAGVFSDNTMNSDDSVLVTISDGELVVRGEGSAGWFEESARIRYQGDDIEFEVHPDALQSILKHTNEISVDKNILKFQCGDFSHLIWTRVPKPRKK